MWPEWLQSTQWWTKILSIVAIVGLATMGAGFALEQKNIVVAGLLLCGPLVLGGALALVIGVPYLWWTDPRRQRGKK